LPICGWPSAANTRQLPDPLGAGRSPAGEKPRGSPFLATLGLMSVAEKLTARLPKIADRGDKTDVVSVVKLHGVITPQASAFSRGVLNVNTVERSEEHTSELQSREK